jgi:TonB family protein
MIALTLKATVILAAASGVAVCLRRGPAALRHFLWTTALAAILVLPLLSLAPPAETVTTSAIVVSAVAGPAPLPAHTPGREIPWLAIVYAVGAAAAAARFAVGAWAVSRLARRASASTLGDELGVRVLLSTEAPMPLAWGIRRPVVLLPAAAESWPAARLRSVLLHETMHHRRRDLPAQAVAQAACCLYWFHPLAWFALARQRSERERACDDAVLAQGISAPEYASHLVEVVRGFAAARRGWSSAPAMAETSGLEARVVAVLDGGTDRSPLSRRGALGIAIAALVLLAPLTIVTVRAQGPNSIYGVVEDPSGARVPNCRVSAKNLDGSNVDETTADLAGEYRFVNLPSGRYELSFASQGFAISRQFTTLVSGAAARLDGRLQVGSVKETVTVKGARSAVAAPKPAAAPRRIPIGGNVQPLRIVRQVRPVYPPELQQAGVEGTVVLRAVISKEGTILNMDVVSTSDPRLNQAALDAVSQWRYQPTLLNGQPVETLTSIDIRFELGQ